MADSARPDPPPPVGQPDPTRTGPADTPAPGAGATQPAPDTPPDLAPPQRPDELGRLGGYRVLRLLGRGGMGAVYAAEDLALRRPVALKTMRPDLARHDDARVRFLREARAAAAVESDHIVRIYQVGEDGGVPFIAMELLRGRPLDAWMKGHAAAVWQVLKIGYETALGLAVAHERGLIHRDIKPANLWLEAPNGRVKVLDFGLARSARQDAGLTGQGVILGTPAYMAREQARGLAVDPRCDLFSLGAVLYELVTGRRPFQGPDALAVLAALAMTVPPQPHEVNPGVPPALSDLIMRLLAKDPDGRPSHPLPVTPEDGDEFLRVPVEPLLRRDVLRVEVVEREHRLRLHRRHRRDQVGRRRFVLPAGRRLARARLRLGPPLRHRLLILVGRRGWPVPGD